MTTGETSYSQIEVDLSTTDDFAIANVRYAFAAQAVPEPGTALLCLLAGVSLLLAPRRRSTATRR